MAVVREYAQCTACNCRFILRVGVGVEASCTHTFDCPNCHTPISLDLLTGRPGQAWVKPREGVSVISRDDSIEMVVNLHPAFAFKRSDFRSQYAFASGYHISLVYGKIRTSGGRGQDFATQFEVPETSKIWAIVRSVLVLTLKGDPGGILQKQIDAYESARRQYKPGFTCPAAFKCVASFFDDIFYPAIGRLRSPLRAFVRAQFDAYPIEMDRLKNYYRTHLQAQALERYLSTLSDYFRLFDQFRQVLTHVRVGSDDVDDLIVGSKRFDEIKLYYGQAYETLTSSYTTLACLNNVCAGRPFDEFKSMTLTKYLNDVEKSKKSNPFAGVPELRAFTAFENSSLRNGSHHASIWRDGDLIKFRSGGTGAERDMAYSRYMHCCNGITISIAALLLVELEFLSTMAL